jgi:cell division protein ZapA (FtsZ GTPase activity inhibitor)
VPKRAVAVQIRGQEFRILSDDDEGWLQRVAGYLDETMATVEERTGTVDSLDVALLTALNLARELVEIREGARCEGARGRPPARLDRARRVRAASGGGLSRRRGTSYPGRHVR